MYIDIFIIVILLFAIWKGWENGFLHELVSSLGFILGLIVACLCYRYVGQYLTVNGTSTNIITSIIAFFGLWIIAPIALGTVATSITKILNKLPLLSLPNRIGGMFVSGFKYLLLLSLALNVMSAIHILNPKRAEGSRLMEPTTSVTKLLTRSVTQAVTPHTIQHDTIQQNDTVWIEV